MSKKSYPVAPQTRTKMIELDQYLMVLSVLGVCPIDAWSDTSIEWLRTMSEVE